MNGLLRAVHVDPVLVGNSLRALTFVCSGGIVLLTLLTIYLYGWRYLADRRVVRAQGRRLGWRGLLPGHVLLISVSYLGYLAVALRLVFVNLDRGPTWRTWVVAVASVTGVLAMYALLRWQQRLCPRREELPAPEHGKGRRRA